MKNFITISEASELFGTSESTIYNRIKRGDLKSKVVKIGNKSSTLVEYISEEKQHKGNTSGGESSFAILSSQILFLQKQLEEKDRQLQEMSNKLTQEQVLTREAMQRIPLLSAPTGTSTSVEAHKPKREKLTKVTSKKRKKKRGLFGLWK